MVTTTDERGPRYLLVDAPPGADVDELHARLAPSADPGAPGPRRPLLHGYAVGGRREQSPSTCPVRLVVVAGPDAGGSVPAPPGRWVTVGRGTSCDLTVQDPALSREHVRVRHERSGIVVQDLGSTNGLRWDVDAPSGEEQARDIALAQDAGREGGDRTGRGVGTVWPPGSTLVLGATRLAIVLEPLPPAAVREHDGRLLVTPWPRHPPERTPVRLSSPTRPRRREVRAPSAWVWALPLVAAVVIALVLRMPMVLLFGLMAPTMVLGHHLGERRAARIDHRAALHQHSQDLEELRLRTARAVSEELEVLRARHPGVLGVVTALLPSPTTRLWSHGGEPPTVVLGEGGVTTDIELDGSALEHAAAPVVLDLSQPVAVIGRPQLRAGMVRSWLLQLACAHPPSELTLVVDPDSPPGAGWDLLAWLAHTRPAPGPETPVRIRWGHAGGLLLLDDAREAPAGVVQVVLDSAAGAVLRRPGRTDIRFRPTMLGLPLARRLARTLAALDHEDPALGGGPGPRTLGDLMPWPADEDQVRTGWSTTGPDLRVPIGTDDAGTPVVVDLARDGPHALIAGTTGSGKSELLRTLVTALALRNPPSSLCLLLIDYKGGSSLAECAALPHATGLVTDLDPHLAERVLVSLRAELRRREAVLAQAGVRDVRDLAGDSLPRLLVVIDEFRVLAEELPDFMGGLVRLAAVGRSLGVHLVLATQRPAGVVSADLRANVNLRIALRVRDAADSLDVLDTADAATLPEGQPGLALLRTGSSPARPVRVGPAAPALAVSRRTGWRIEEVDGVWSGWAAVRAPDAARAVDSRLDSLPALLGRVAEQDAQVTPRVWHPPLDAIMTMDAPGCWALADRPETQRHVPVTWTASHIGVVGAARSGRTTAARSLVTAAGPAWLYVVDPARGLDGTELSSHPGLRAWVGPHDPAHAIRVLEVVNDVVDVRLARGAGPGEVPVLMVVDGWDRFVDAYGDTGQGRARDLALRVLRDGPAAGVVAVLTGDRSLLTGAVASSLAQTWALRLHDPGDLALAGLRPHQVPSDQPPGRAVRTKDGLVAQVLLPTGSVWAPATPHGTPPPRVVSLPAAPDDQDAWAVGGDDATALPVPAAPFLVLGPPGSGVTATLSVLAKRYGHTVLLVDAAAALDADALAERLAGFAGTVVVDDADLLAGGGVEEVVLAWAGRSGGRLVVGAELEAASTLFRGLVPQVARHRRGLILQPTTPAHGTLLGVRLPVVDRLVPGRGVLVDLGRCTRVQVCGLSPPAAPR